MLRQPHDIKVGGMAGFSMSQPSASRSETSTGPTVSNGIAFISGLSLVYLWWTYDSMQEATFSSSSRKHDKLGTYNRDIRSWINKWIESFYIFKLM